MKISLVWESKKWCKFIKQSHRCGKQTYGFWDGGEEKEGEGINWEIRIDIYTPF